MLATIITDVFRKDEAIQIAAALDELCSPEDRYGWASAGVYSFWDIRTREIYYIGLAIDLSMRFRQHTGLKSCNSDSCKIQQITEHFQMQEFLGYSVFVQSCLDQPPTAKNVEVFRRASEGRKIDYKDLIGMGQQNIVNAEGTLIEAYKRRNGRRPQWNKIDGAKNITVYEGVEVLLDCLTAINIGAFVARSKLRTLAENPRLEGYEELVLHPIRMLMFQHGMTFIEAVTTQKTLDAMAGTGFADRYEQMLVDKYLEKIPNFSL